MIRTTFLGSIKSNYKSEMECFYTNLNEVLITIKHMDEVEMISLDRKTAIKFAKTLRTEIAKIKEDI